MSTYSLINNGDTGLSVRTTLNSLLTDINTGAVGSAGTSGVSGSSGTSGANGSSGTSGANGSSGTSGVSGSSGTSGNSGSSGTSGISGSSGTSGTGSSGTSGINGATGSGYLITSMSLDGSFTAATGSKVLYIKSNSAYNPLTSYAYSTGTRVRYSASISQYFEGTVTAIAATALSLDVDLVVGSTSYTTGNLTVAGLPGSAGSVGSGTFSNLVNVATVDSRLRVFSGNVNPTYDIQLEGQGSTYVRMKDGGQVVVEPAGSVWIGDASTFNGSYAVLLGRGVSNNNEPQQLMGFGAVSGGGNVRDSFAVGQSSLGGSTIGHRYQDFTAAMGFSLTARMRDAINTHKLHLNRIPGQFIWSTASSAYVSHGGFKNDTDFYTNYIGRDATTPSGATHGSVYAQPGGNLIIAGSGGYSYLDIGLSFSDDSAAATGGVAVGQLYHTGGSVKVRLS